MMEKQITHYWNDGRAVPLRRYTPEFEKHFPAHTSHFRVGQFACSVNEGVGLFVSARAYDCDFIDDPKCVIGRDSEYFTDFRRNRLDALKRAETVIAADHPHRAELDAAIKREREYLG
jgi:hypothetical protein